MKSRVGKIIWWIISLALTVFIMWCITPGYIFSSDITKAKEFHDFSTAHGEGYTQEENRFTVTENKSYFIYDLQELDKDYSALCLVFDPDGFDKKQDVTVRVGYAASADMGDIKYISGILKAGESVLKLEQDFEKKRYLSISVDIPIGSTYILDAIEIEEPKTTLNAAAVLVSLTLATVLWGVILLVRRVFGAGLKKLAAKIERMFDQYSIVAASVFQVTILLYFILSNHLVFALNDDTLKVAMAGGAYGKPSEYLGYNTIHILLGWMFKFLFTYLPVINWITVFYLVVESVSVFGMQVLLLRKSKIQDSSIRFLIMATLNIFYFLCLSYFTFTVVSYTAAIFGGVELFQVISKREDKGKEKKHILLGMTGIVLACLIRPAVCQAILIVMGIYSVYVLIKSRAYQGILLCICCVILMKGIQISNEKIVCSSDVERDFYQWSKIRVEALDARQISWDDNAEQLEKSGITEDMYEILYSARYVDSDITSEQNLKTLNSLNVSGSAKYNTSFIDYVKQQFHFLTKVTEIQNIYKFLFWFVWIFSILRYKRKIENVVLGIAPMMVEWIFVFLNRNLYRVTMPVYFFALLLILVNCGRADDDYAIETKQKHICNYISLAAIGSIWILLLNAFRIEWKNYDYELRTNANEVITYMEKNQDKLFFPVSSDMYALEVYRPVFQYAGQNGICYLCGNGETYSEPYYEVMQHFNIKDPDHPILEAVDNDGVYILGTADVSEAKKMYQPILNYIGQKKNEGVDLVPVEKVTEKFSAYKLVSR